MVTAGSDHKLVLWDLRKPDFASYEQIPIPDWALSAAFNSDGKWLALGYHDKGVQLWKFDSRENIGSLPSGVAGEGRVFSVAFSSDTQFVMWAGDSGELRMFALKDGYQLKYPAYRDAILDGSFNTNKSRFVTAGRDGKMAIWDLARISPIAEQSVDLNLKGDWMSTLDVEPSGRYAVTGDTKGWLHVVDLQGHDPIRSIQTTANRVNDLHLDANGSELAVAGDDGKVSFWNRSNGEMHLDGNVEHFSSMPVRLAWLHSTRDLLVLSKDGNLYRVTGKTKVHLLGKAIEILADWVGPLHLAVDPSEKIVAVTARFELWMFDLDTLRTWKVDNLGDQVGDLEFTPDGKSLLCGHGSFVDLRDPRTGKAAAQLFTTRVTVSRLAVTSDSDLLMAADSEHGITFWNLHDRIQIGPSLTLPGADVGGLLYLKAPNRFLSAERNYLNLQNRYQFRFWTPSPSDWRRIAEQTANRSLTEMEAHRFGLELGR
jgi:WD40 repeat protein